MEGKEGENGGNGVVVQRAVRKERERDRQLILT